MVDAAARGWRDNSDILGKQVVEERILPILWEEYFKAHPKDTELKYGTFEDYEDLEIAIGNGVAVGKNSIGLGNATNARTLGASEGGVIEKLDKISTSFEKIYSLLEKRERERQYTIWDAIKEIPNLEEDTRFKVIELLDAKGKKDVFLKMSSEERSS
ncbi:hypothetical protein LguiB_006312 [Lonicera macranthoides]